ncbi:MAG: helix-turn-helix domain-containing protein [Erythrobacter sp.]|nr:helix-turn-helix domain-containing protein [Erythrobacter sp.]
MPRKNDLTLGEEIRAQRLSRGWDQTELAERVGAVKETVSRWENGRVPDKPWHIEGLKRELGLTKGHFLEAFGAKIRTNLRTKDRYQACSFRTAKDIVGSFETIDAAFGEIEENDFPVPTELGEYGTPEKWLRLLKMFPDSGGVVIFDNKTIVAYWQSFAVNDATYEGILRGDNINKSISESDIELLMEPGEYKLFFISLFIRMEHRGYRVRSLLRQDFIDFIRDTADEGIFFTHIAANITGIEAKRICERFGLRKVIDHPIHRYPEGEDTPEFAEIFELDLSAGAARLFETEPDIAEKYEANGIPVRSTAMRASTNS